jgi:hypothetical protein
MRRSDMPTTDTTYTTGPVCLDETVTVLAVYDPSHRWNGWLAAPRMDAHSVVTVLDALEAAYDRPEDAEIYGTDYRWDEDGSLLVRDRQWLWEAETEEETAAASVWERIPADADGLYTPGAFGWVWSEDEPDAALSNPLDGVTGPDGVVWTWNVYTYPGGADTVFAAGVGVEDYAVHVPADTPRTRDNLRTIVARFHAAPVMTHTYPTHP